LYKNLTILTICKYGRYLGTAIFHPKTALVAEKWAFLDVWHDYCCITEKTVSPKPLYAPAGKQNMAKVTNITDFLETGMKAAGLRHNAIANNIANLETTGYRRLDVKFEQLLQKALDSAGPVRPGQIQPQIHQPKQTPVKSNGNDVNLESEIGQMLKNILRYKTYVRLLNKKYDQLNLAIKV